MALDPFLNSLLGDSSSAPLSTTEVRELSLPWPKPGNPAGFLTFTSLDHWRTFVDTLDLNPIIPVVVNSIYRRSQRIFLMGWSDAGMFKIAELIALTALEAALNDRYGDLVRQRKATKGVRIPVGKPLKFEELLVYMIEDDDLTDDKLPFIQQYGGSVLRMLRPKRSERHGERPSQWMNLADIRNSLAHGINLDGLPWSGLQELVRDLIEFSFRTYLAECQHLA